MKSRHREVNIFNMSLLDILCGALGAFCFLMLSLFPDHAKVQQLQAQVQDLQQTSGGPDAKKALEDAKQDARKAVEERDKARAEQNLAFVKIVWNEPVDVDLWLMSPGGKFYAPKKDDVPPDKFLDTTSDTKSGPGGEQIWLTNAAYPGAIYRVFAKIYGAGGASPVRLNVYTAGRTHSGPDHSAMSVWDLSPAVLTTPGTLVELGRLEFASGDIRSYAGPMRQAGGTTQMLGGGALPRLLDAPGLPNTDGRAAARP